MERLNLIFSGFWKTSIVTAFFVCLNGDSSNLFSQKLFQSFSLNENLKTNTFLDSNIASNPHDNLYEIYHNELSEIKAQVIAADPDIGIVERIQKVSQIIDTKNKDFLHQLNANESFEGVRKAAFVVDLLRQEMLKHKVVGAKSKYWGISKEGYCFGRAIYAHRKLVEQGVSSDSILKVFALGDLYYKGVFWKFHVATMIKDQNSKWWVVDTMFQKSYPLDQWMEQVRIMSVKKTASHVRFYASNPFKVYPFPSHYGTQVVSHPRIKEFYEDLASIL